MLLHKFGGVLVVKHSLFNSIDTIRQHLANVGHDLIHPDSTKNPMEQTPKM
jgi:hypothetical protein